MQLIASTYSADFCFLILLTVVKTRYPMYIIFEPIFCKNLKHLRRQRERALVILAEAVKSVDIDDANCYTVIKLYNGAVISLSCPIEHLSYYRWSFIVDEAHFKK